MDKVLQILVLITIPTYFLLPLAGDGSATELLTRMLPSIFSQKVLG